MEPKHFRGISFGGTTFWATHIDWIIYIYIYIRVDKLAGGWKGAKELGGGGEKLPSWASTPPPPKKKRKQKEEQKNQAAFRPS